MLHQVFDARLHNIDQRLRPDTDYNHTQRQYSQDAELAPVDVLQRGYLFVGNITKHHTLDHPQRIGRTEYQGKRGRCSIPEIYLKA